ncbi:MAG TPA: condensation domain-containing protein, partial [Terrimicrobiaceae bacterium]
MNSASELAKRIAALSPAKRGILMQRLQEKGQGSPRDPIHRRNHQELAPLSFAQERLWFLAALEPESVAYNLGQAYRLKGPLTVAALEKSLAEIVNRHEVLRTTFASEDGKAVQLVTPHQPAKLPVVDLTNFPEAERLGRASKYAEEEFLRPFSLTSGRLVRSKLYRLTEIEHLLVIVVHHIAFDGWSSGIFDRELSEFYNALCRGKEPVLSILPIQYADYAVWQRGQQEGASLESLSYWKDALKDAPFLELPTDAPRSAKQSHAGGRYTFRLPPHVCHQLGEFSRRENVTHFMTLLAAYQVLLSRYSGQDDFLIGTPVANRPNVEAEQLIGLFVNPLVLRADLSGDPGFREVVARVRRRTLDAFQHQHLPFERLVQEIYSERDPSRHPLFQTTFALRNTPEDRLELSGLEVSWHTLPSCA